MRLQTAVALIACAAGWAQVRVVDDPGVVTTRQSITPAGVQTTFQGRVYGVAFGRSSAEIWVLNAGQVYRMDWKANRVIERVPYEGSAGLQGIQYDAGADRALVSTTGKARTVRLVAVEKGAARVVADSLGVQIAGALALNSRMAAVPLIYDNKLAVVDLESGKVRATLATGIAPFGAAINREGTVAWVSNWGGRVPGPKDLTAPTGLSRTADRVVVDAEGKAATGTLTRLDLETGLATHTVAVDLHPTAILWDEPRNRLFVANGNQDSVSVIDTAQNRVARTIPLQPFREKVSGIAPTALALSPDGATLYVALGGINAVAVVQDGKVAGMIPTAWYPNGLSLSADGKFLAVSTLLGPGSGWREEPRKKYVHANRGSVSVLPVPAAADLASFTTAVAENNHLTVGAPSPAKRPAPPPEFARIEHVVYVIKENRTYDQVFGDIQRGNGDPSLVMFGEEVTPNQHRLANQFVLLDNFYATGGNSGDGHQWLTQANETAYCLWPGYVGRSYPFDGTDPIAYAQGGFIWDAALKMKKTVRIYGEYAGRLGERNGERVDLLKRWKKGEDFTSMFQTVAPIQALNRILAKNYPPYTTEIPDVLRTQIFLKDLKQWERDGQMPNLTIVQLPSNHTRGASPGTSSAKAMVADNDLALGQMVEALTKSPFWKSMAIFVVEDDAQNGVDHVDGHRTVALVVSPYARREHLDSTFYSHPSILKTIELMLGLPSLSLFDLIANDMRASFQEKPDMTPYAAVEPRQSIFEVNPPAAALRGEARRAALDSRKMRFDVPDAAPTERLNRILWHQVKGWGTPYPGARQAVFAPLSVDLDDE